MKKYTLALDIGTTSVGWTIIDENYQIPSYNGKNLWGVRLFNSASTAELTRNFRGTRRRYGKRRRRLELLQFLFQDEIDKVDETFFNVKVNESEWLRNRFVSSDGDIQYFFENRSLAETLKIMGESTRKYRNIYFLQKDIIESGEKFDLRLLYLAIFSNVKYRGHFLDNFNFKDFKAGSNIKVDLMNYLEHEEELDYYEEVVKILKSSDGINSKKNSLKKIVKNDLVTRTRLEMLTGASSSISKMFFDGEYQDLSIKITEESPLDDNKIQDISDVHYDILEKGYNIYLNLVLNKIMRGNENICSAQVENYYIFKDDLKLFKKLVKEYSMDEYKKIFKKDGILDNYLYGKKYKNKANESYVKDFKEKSYKTIVSSLNKLNKSNKDVEYLRAKYADGEFLLKQRSKVNASTPHQLKAKDVYDMLNSQKKYYDFIDDEFINKVVTLITYRIPYFVGPLSKKEGDSKFSWVIRKSDGKITPWNIDSKIDKDATAEKFINRMINKCQYLYNVNSDIDNKVMSKDSLTYQLYMMHNELNGIRLKNKEVYNKIEILTKEQKNRIIEHIFKKNSGKTAKQVLLVLGLDENRYELIGTQDDGKFASSLSTYSKFSKYVNNPLNYIDEIDEVIRILNVFDDEEIIRRQLGKFQFINDNNINDIMNIKVSGWGRLSKYLLREIKSNGKSILDCLIEGDDKKVVNFQYLVTTKDYTFSEQINKLNIPEENNLEYEDVEKLAGSPALKRGIWQSLLIVKELDELEGIDIDTIAIEFAGGDEKKQRSTPFEKQLEAAIKNDNELYKNIENEKEFANFKDERVRLYLLQAGKCLYSGEELNIENLSQYEIDHIRAQSFTKDNSINNKALVKSVYNQDKGDDKTVIETIKEKNINVFKMRDFWERLLKANAISQVKYQRLIKENYAEIELDRFIQRTLVETRQIGKHVKEILSNYFEDNKTIINVSSHFTSKFRKAFEILKIRDLSVRHHCEDAYIIATVSQYALNKYGKGFFELGNKNTKAYYSKKNMTSKDKAGIIISGLRKELSSNSVQFVRDEFNKDFNNSIKLSGSGTKEFWEQTTYSPNEKKKSKFLDLVDSTKSVRNEFKMAYFLLVEYDKKSGKKYKRERKLLAVPNIVDVNKKRFKTYIEVADYLLNENFGNGENTFNNLSIIDRIEIGQLIASNDGIRYTIKSVGERTNQTEAKFTKEFIDSVNFIMQCKTKENLETIEVSEVEFHFNLICEFVEENYCNIYGKNVKELGENFNKNILEKDQESFNKNLNKTLVDGFEKIEKIYNYFDNECFFSDAQIKLLKQEKISAKTINQKLGILFDIYSCGNQSKYKLIKDSYELKIELEKNKEVIKSYVKFVEELLKAISIGPGRSEKLMVGRVRNTIKLEETLIIHQSATGIYEKYTESLQNFKKNKKLKRKI